MPLAEKGTEIFNELKEALKVKRVRIVTARNGDIYYKFNFNGRPASLEESLYQELIEEIKKEAKERFNKLEDGRIERILRDNKVLKPNI